MSNILIQQYLNQLATLRKVSGSSREGVVSEAFKDLLKGWARSQHPTIREKFNTYRFADYKEKVIDLLMRVTTVNVGTMEVVGEMRNQ